MPEPNGQAIGFRSCHASALNLSIEMADFPIESPQAVFGCAGCAGRHGYVNRGRVHWFFCRVHRTRWCIGCDLIQGWDEESDSTQQEHWNLIAGFIDVTAWRQSVPGGKVFLRSLIALLKKEWPELHRGE
jgi:hypothetical protein